ncbi:MAG: peptidyl-prolyl cis-trans isomerase [Geobacteraceae bacterium]|nr:peptidyl-prolyl cis-trans isomerase [Geobacteraceae bacterium]
MRAKLVSLLSSSVLILFFLSQLSYAGTNVVIHTDHGNIEIALNEELAPETTENFLHYVDSGFYAGTVFHRVIPDFMLQGGGFTKNMAKKITADPIENEADNGLTNKRGTIAMARTNRVNSATSQFFINVVDNGFLDHRNSSPSGFGYAVFGEVVAGMDVVDKIAAVATTSKKGMRDVPIKTVIIKSIKRM